MTMTDATTTQAGTAGVRRVTEHLADAARELVTGLVTLPGRLAALRATMRDERDFDRIHDTLSRLNARQLAMLGLKRDEIYTFAELCVYQPERRPELRLFDRGPAMTLAAPVAQAALPAAGGDAPAVAAIGTDAPGAEVQAGDAAVETPAVETAATGSPATEVTRPANEAAAKDSAHVIDRAAA